MIVVGGTYFESCSWPPHNSLLGSGMRSVAAISAVEPELTLLSCVEDGSRLGASAIAAGFGVSGRWVRRTGLIGFTYTTPLSTPIAHGRSERAEEALVAEDAAVLVFGMLEASAEIRADHLVFDPQSPLDLGSLDLGRLKADHVAVVLNRGEAARLTKKDSPHEAGSAIVASGRAEVAIVKLGAAGALVTTPAYQVIVGAHPTNSVYPVGTGDVFAAGFAWAWAAHRQPPEIAAAVGSRFAASWASTEVLPVPAVVAAGDGDLPPAIVGPAPQVYLAAPYFTLSQRWLVDLTREALSSLGAVCFSPFHEIGPGSTEVAMADLAAIEASQAVIALCDGYDPGTLFEVGWAVKRGIPVIAFASSDGVEEQKMLVGSGVEVHTDLSTSVYRAIWRGMGAAPRS